MGVVYHANYFIWFEIGRCELLRAIGRSYRELEDEGIGLPVIEAHCEYKSPARYDDELQVKTTGSAAVAGAGRVRYEVSRPATARSTPSAGRCMPRSNDRAALPAARVHPGAPPMKALVTGAAGFIGSHLSARPARFGRPRHGHRLLHRLLSPAAEGGQPGHRAGRPGFTFVEGRAAGHRPEAAAGRRHPRVPPGRPGRGPKELGTRFRRLYKEQRRGDSAPPGSAGRDADPTIRLRVELVGLWR